LIEKTLKSSQQVIIAKWLPSIEQLKNEYGIAKESEFASLLAFLGFQLTLWPVWLMICQREGEQLAPELINTNTKEDITMDISWHAVYGVINELLGWYVIQSGSLKSTVKVIEAMKRLEVRQVISQSTQGQALSFWGVATEQLNGLGIYAGANRKLKVPVLTVEELQARRPLWLQLRDQAIEPMEQLVRVAIHEGKRQRHLKNVYNLLIASIWNEMIARGIIVCGPAKSRSFLSSIGLKKEPQIFSGLCLIYGDHRKLWQQLEGEDEQWLLAHLEE